MMRDDVALLIRAFADRLLRPDWGHLEMRSDTDNLLTLAVRNELPASAIVPALDRMVEVYADWYWDDEMCDHFGPDEYDLAYAYAQEAAFIERFGY